jgi:hypothetical protein
MNDELTLWFETLCLLHSSRPQEPVDAVVIHSRSHERDGDGLLEVAAELIHAKMAKKIVINGSNGESLKDPAHKAWPGRDAYEKQLGRLGIFDVMLSRAARHTREESEMFAEVIENMGWKSVVVVNLGHCLPRAMCGWLNEIGPTKRNLPVKLYPIAPVSLNWKVMVHGQQGIEKAPRIDQCRGELERLLRYQKKYSHNFVPLSTLVNYLLKLNTN